jgi:hypothetical protein
LQLRCLLCKVAGLWPPPVNDDPANAIELIVGADATIGSNVGATASEGGGAFIQVPGCGAYRGGDVWYKVAVPESGNLDVETDFSGSGMDTVLGIYSYNPSDGYLVIACDDDGGSELYSRIKLISQEEFLYVRVWTYGDNSRGTFKIAATDIDTTPPVARATDKEVTLDSSGNASITPEEVGNESTDNSGVEPSYTLSKTTFDCSNLGTSVEVILTATDASGNSSSATAIVTVVDNISPSITLNGAAAVTHDAYTDYIDSGATTADNCSATLVTTGAVDSNIPADYSITYTATDASGNISSSTRIVTVVDNTPPVARATDKEVTLDSSGNASISPEEVGNGSTDDSGVEPTYTLSKTTFDCSNIGVNAVTLTAIDVNGNTSSATAVVTVIDANAATVTFTAPTDLCIGAGEQRSLSGGLPSGGVYSGTGVTDDRNGSTYSFNPATAGDGTHSIRYTFTNASGCAASASDDVAVLEPAGPVVDVITVTVDGGCGSYAGFYNYTSMLNYKKSYSTTNAGNVISYNGSKWVLQQSGGSMRVLFENSTVSADVTPPLTGWVATRYCSRSTMEVGLGVNFTSTARAEDLARVTTGANLRFYDVATAGTPLHSAERLSKTVYYVSDTGTATGCESKRTEFNVNIEDGGGRTRTRTRNTKFASSSDKTALDTEGLENKVLFSMYPNPSAENVTLSSSMDGDFRIFNLVGQVVKTFTVKANLETVVYVGDLSAGTYVVKPTNSSSISSQKLIIRK